MEGSIPLYDIYLNGRISNMFTRCILNALYHCIGCTRIIHRVVYHTERRRIRAERKVLKMNAEKELDVWGKVKRERYDLPEFCEYDEETFDHFESFCATRIQACWRMFAARQHYRRVRWAAMTIQRYWRVWGFVMRPKKRLLERSARSIQRAWRGFAQRRTFAQIRDVVRFKGTSQWFSLSLALHVLSTHYTRE